MALHLIPDGDGLPHAPTTECGCGPALVDFEDPDDGVRRPAFMHLSLRDFDARGAEVGDYAEG